MASRKYDRELRGQKLFYKERRLNHEKYEAQRAVQDAKENTEVFRSWATGLPATVLVTMITLMALVTGVITFPSSAVAAIGGMLLGFTGITLTSAGLALAASKLWNKISPVSRSVAKAERNLKEIEHSLQQVRTLIRNRDQLGNDGMPFGGIEADRYAELKIQLHNSKLRTAVQEAISSPELQKLIENSTDEETKKLLRGITRLAPLSPKQIQEVESELQKKDAAYRNRNKKAVAEFQTAHAKIKAKKNVPAPWANMFDTVRVK